MRKILPLGGMNFMSRVKTQAELDLIQDAVSLLSHDKGGNITNSELLTFVLQHYVSGHINRMGRPRL
jgi:hypothetical protein